MKCFGKRFDAECVCEYGTLCFYFTCLSKDIPEEAVILTEETDPNRLSCFGMDWWDCEYDENCEWSTDCVFRVGHKLEDTVAILEEFS